jgi:hypothetical protein
MNDSKEAGKKVRPICKKENLVSLVWPSNTCHSTLIEGIPKGVIVDTEAGTWTFHGHTYPIGGNHKLAPFGEARGYPLAIFDKTNFSDLEVMKRIAEWAKERDKKDYSDQAD